ncbi:hypothetical protein DFH28DRAFT_1126627 [Melampsora americana]|nr:hypothetical protein DFH28DRAFT_1126627 [Melampsora americana]
MPHPKFFPQPPRASQNETPDRSHRPSRPQPQANSSENQRPVSETEGPQTRSGSRVQKQPPGSISGQNSRNLGPVRSSKRIARSTASKASSPIRPPPQTQTNIPGEPLFRPEDLDQFQIGPDELCHDHHSSSEEKNGARRKESSVATSIRAPLDTSISLTHMTGARLQVFNRLASRADLDEHHQAIGRRIFSAAPEDQMMAMMVTVEYASKGGGPTTTHAPWLSKEESLELRGCIRQMAHKEIMQGDIQAYSATKDRNGPKKNLPMSLFATVISAILASPAEWKKRLLPPGYGKDPNPKYSKSFHTLVNNVLKDIRKEFETTLLENIQLPNRVLSAGNGRVPKIKDVIVKLHEKCALSIGGRFLVREDILKQIQHLQEAWIAYLRLQACHWGLNKAAEYNGATLWSVVDDKLEYLRGQNTQYRYAFAILCLTADFEIFSGKKTFEELKDLTTFGIPHKTAIRDMQKELDEIYPGQLAGDEGDYQGTETEGEEDA